MLVFSRFLNRFLPRASPTFLATMVKFPQQPTTTPATTSPNSRPPDYFPPPNFGSAPPPYLRTSALLCVIIRPRQSVRVRRFSHTIENKAHPPADPFPRTEACRDNADDVPSPMTIDKALRHDISNVLATREDAEAACKLARARVKIQSKIGHNRQPPAQHPSSSS